jgi:hypothetical protein
MTTTGLGSTGVEYQATGQIMCASDCVGVLLHYCITVSLSGGVLSQSGFPYLVDTSQEHAWRDRWN